MRKSNALESGLRFGSRFPQHPIDQRDNKDGGNIHARRNERSIHLKQILAREKTNPRKDKMVSKWLYSLDRQRKKMYDYYVIP